MLAVIVCQRLVFRTHSWCAQGASIQGMGANAGNFARCHAIFCILIAAVVSPSSSRPGAKCSAFAATLEAKL